MDGIIYLTLDQAKAIHAKTIQYSGGGTTEPLDTGKLENWKVYWRIFRMMIIIQHSLTS